MQKLQSCNFLITYVPDWVVRDNYFDFRIEEANIIQVAAVVIAWVAASEMQKTCKNAECESKLKEKSLWFLTVFFVKYSWVLTPKH